MQRLPWMEPLAAAARIDQPYWALLYSGAQTGYSGRYSYLALDLAERVEGDSFAPLAGKLESNAEGWNNRWFGYLGYGLKDSLEELRRDEPWAFSLPHLCMMRFHTVIEFDHREKTLAAWSDRGEISLPACERSRSADIRVKDIRSNMSKTDYLSKAALVIERIHAGELYQANLTRKFFGEFAAPCDGFALFEKLCAASPAPYSAYLRLGDSHVLSSSPELFLKIEAEGGVRTRPIKGTAPRHEDAAQDKKSREALAASAKDRAENLMIVDLMRNDLSRGCVSGSIMVRDLFEVTSHATIHHMSSTVTGKKRDDCSVLDLVKSCFPPGSMTGAPKIRAMNLCSELERQARGIYSGAAGWIAGQACELSVVIRTLIVQNDRFEFQVGGAIVADSTPKKELAELIAKSRGLCTALGISGKMLENI